MLFRLPVIGCCNYISEIENPDEGRRRLGSSLRDRRLCVHLSGASESAEMSKWHPADPHSTRAGTTGRDVRQGGSLVRDDRSHKMSFTAVSALAMADDGVVSIKTFELRLPFYLLS